MIDCLEALAQAAGSETCFVNVAAGLLDVARQRFHMLLEAFEFLLQALQFAAQFAGMAVGGVVTDQGAHGGEQCCECGR